MKKQTILTGLRANNDLHIGNYFGALLPLIEMAKIHAGKYTINLFVPDLHSFTTPIDHSELKEQIDNNLRLFVAAGLPLDIPDVNIYRQSYVSAHSALTVILNCFTSMGELSRMTQFKEKSKNYDSASSTLKEIKKLNQERGDVLESINLTKRQINGKDVDLATVNRYLGLFNALYAVGNVQEPSVGLFDYPVLMAADILLYNAELVPVGDDQSQHLEITRDLAQRLNAKFDSELFTIPLAVQKQHEFFGKEQGLRIKDLQTPTKKMSKSDESGKGVIFLGDDPDVAAKKIMSATTDSVGEVHYDPENQPGISNLLQLLALISSTTLKDTITQYEGQTQYGPLKKDLAERMKTFLTDFQARLKSVDQKQLGAKLESSEAQMNITANKTLLRVQKAIGIR
jgi:tryptophanyl-tRNA synthetase